MVVFIVTFLCKFFKNSALTCAQILWHLYSNAHILIAARTAPDIWNSLTLHTEFCPRLSTLWEALSYFSVNCRNFNFAAKCRLYKGNRNVTIYVVTLADKYVILLYINCDK